MSREQGCRNVTIGERACESLIPFWRKTSVSTKFFIQIYGCLVLVNRLPWKHLCLKKEGKMLGSNNPDRQLEGKSLRGTSGCLYLYMFMCICTYICMCVSDPSPLSPQSSSFLDTYWSPLPAVRWLCVSIYLYVC